MRVSSIVQAEASGARSFGVEVVKASRLLQEEVAWEGLRWEGGGRAVVAGGISSGQIRQKPAHAERCLVGLVVLWSRLAQRACSAVGLAPPRRAE